MQNVIIGELIAPLALEESHVGFKNRLRIEADVLLGRAIRPIMAQRPRGIAIFLPQAKPNELFSYDKLLTKDSVVRAVTSTREYTFTNFDHHSWARDEKGEKVKIDGSRSHDGLAFGNHIAFHQDCATKFSPASSSTSVTTSAILHLYIDDVQVF